MTAIRVGSGAGFADDRIEPAVELAEHGQLDYLVFECLAERTIALAQRERLRDPLAGFNPWLGERMDAVLGHCARAGIRIITNMGAANPLAAAELVADLARRKGLPGLKIAAVTGDDVLGLVAGSDLPLLDRPGTIASLGESVISANAYLGCEDIVQALADGADVVITGRVADPSLYLAPLVHAFGWRLDDWDRLGQGVCVGHLLECAGQVTGGYFADPGVKDVPGLARLGFPLAQVTAGGAVTITKGPGPGGPGERAHLHRAAAVRGARPRRLRVRRRSSGFLRRLPHPGRPGRGRRHRHHRRPAPGHAQGLGWLPRRVRRGGRDLLRRPERGSTRPPRPRPGARAPGTDRHARRRGPVRADRPGRSAPRYGRDGRRAPGGARPGGRPHRHPQI